jgi:hypothetical protein
MLTTDHTQLYLKETAKKWKADDVRQVDECEHLIKNCSVSSQINEVMLGISSARGLTDIQFHKCSFVPLSFLYN